MNKRNSKPKVFSVDERDAFVENLIGIFENMITQSAQSKGEFDWLEQLHNSGTAFIAEDFDCIANEVWNFLKKHNLVADESQDAKPINTVIKGYWKNFD